MKVRCVNCGWDGDRKTDLLPNTPHPLPCPKCKREVLAGSWLPNSTETTPSGFLIEFYDETRAEFPEATQTRRYLVDGKKLPSVTHLTGLLDKPGVKYWVADHVREGRDWQAELKRAQRRGIASHDVALDLVLGKRRSLSTVDPEHRPYAQAVSAWVLERQPKVIEAERMVASVKHGFSGRFDLHAELRGWPGAPRIDFKSKEKWPVDQDGRRRVPYESEVMQLDLYELAAVESGYESADFGLIVRLGPDGTYDETPFLLSHTRPLSLLDVDASVADAKRALRTGLDREPIAA